MKYISGRFEIQEDEDGNIFIDRDSKYFSMNYYNKCEIKKFRLYFKLSSNRVIFCKI